MNENYSENLCFNRLDQLFSGSGKFDLVKLYSSMSHLPFAFKLKLVLKCMNVNWLQKRNRFSLRIHCLTQKRRFLRFLFVLNKIAFSSFFRRPDGRVIKLSACHAGGLRSGPKFFRVLGPARWSRGWNWPRPLSNLPDWKWGIKYAKKISVFWRGDFDRHMPHGETTTLWHVSTLKKSVRMRFQCIRPRTDMTKIFFHDDEATHVFVSENSWNFF